MDEEKTVKQQTYIHRHSKKTNLPKMISFAQIDIYDLSLKRNELKHKIDRISLRLKDLSHVVDTKREKCEGITSVFLALVRNIEALSCRLAELK